jgi:hypothetical protein
MAAIIAVSPSVLDHVFRAQQGTFKHDLPQFRYRDVRDEVNRMPFVLPSGKDGR